MQEARMDRLWVTAKHAAWQEQPLLCVTAWSRTDHQRVVTAIGLEEGEGARE